MTGDRTPFKNDTDALLYVLSHDLRGPARALRQYCTLMEKELEHTEPNERMDRFVARFQQVLDSMDAQLDGLLALSRIQTPTRPPEAVNLGALVRSALTERNLHGVIHGELPTVWADAARITRLVNELLDNVVHHAGDDAEVSVSFESGRFILADSGDGMEESVLAQAATVFRPISPHGSERQGLGINLCQRIVHSVGGSLELESSVGQGTRVYFELPIQSDG